MKPSKLLILGGAVLLALMILSAMILLKVSLSRDLERPAIDTTELSGEETTMALDTAGVSRVHIYGGWKVSLKQGSGGSGTVRIPVEYSDQLTVEHRGDMLEIRLARGLDGGRDSASRIELELESLRELAADGAADVDLAELKGSSLKLTFAGAVNIRGRGLSGKKLDVRSRGAANIDFSGAVFTDVSLDMEGASNVELQLNGGTLSGRVAGIGSVTYGGKASNQLRTEGMASVSTR